VTNFFNIFCKKAVENQFYYITFQRKKQKNRKKKINAPKDTADRLDFS